MPVTPTYPGVYIAEAPSTSHVINGVTTSDTAFVDVFERGPANVPQRITNFGQFTTTFGALNRKSKASYGIYQFFQNGGATAWVVRVKNKDDKDATAKLEHFTLQAVGPGEWGNNLEAAVQERGGLIDLVIREIAPATSTNPNKSVVTSEIYTGLSLDEDHAQFITNVLQHQSEMAIVEDGSLKPPSGGGGGGGGGDKVTSANSITNPNNVSNAKATGYTSFSGGKATLSISEATDFGVPASPPQQTATGMYTLDQIAPNVFNIMCLPAMASLNSNAWGTAFESAFNYCEQKMAFLIADPPTDAFSSTDAAGQVHDIMTWFEGGDAASVSNQTNHAAVYFPRLMIADPDPAANGSPMNTEASGTLAGIYARTDAARGVWKAPAGNEASLTGVLHPFVKVTDDQDGQLNPLGINAIRTFPVYGTLSWGARTTNGADLLDSQWKYINVRRTALYIEQSLQQGTTWAVFEPNAEPLWASLRLSVGTFMDGLYKQGAFAGSSAKDSYFVQCDATTTTPVDQQQGRVNVNVGFAPLYPAEFVVITISQIINS